MNRVLLLQKMTLVCLVSALCMLSSCASISNNTREVTNRSDNDTEVIVIIRHGEKPEKGLGQLSVAGLKRSLLLPSFFTEHFDRADYVFAPNPAVKHFENHGDKKWYCYVRPLATIEPTAITLGLPVDTTLGLNDTNELVSELLEPKYRHSTIYISWEHSRIVTIAKQIIKELHAPDIRVPEWQGDDFNTVFVFRIDWSKPAGEQLSFTVMSQNLNNLADR